MMIRELERFPKFTITSIRDKQDCFGVFNCDLIIEDNNIGYLIGGLNEAYEGRFYDLNRNISRARFVPKDINDLLHLEVNAQYAYFEGYWGAIAELILDSKKKWEKVKFEAKDSAVYKTDGWNVMGKIGQGKPFETQGEGKVIKGGWDHEHCDICTESIDINDIGYVSGNEAKTEKWVCEKCYSDLILPKSLSYIDDEMILTQILGLEK